MKLSGVVVCFCLVGIVVSFDVAINIDPTNPYGNPSPSDVKNLGATSVRIEYKDSSPQGSPPGAFPFYDPIISNFTSNSISILLILDYSSLPGRPEASSGSDWDSYSKYFADRCGAVAAHYSSQVHAYEIWNEEDLPTVGNIDAGTYGPLLQNAYNSIKGAVGNSAAVIMGGLASGDPSYVSNTMQSTGGILYADAVGIHPYGQRPDPDWPSPTWGFGDITTLLASYESVANVPLWITEDGTDDTSVQGEFPSHLFDTLETIPYVPICYWFCWSDGMVPPFGLLYENGTKKESYYNYQQWVQSQ